MGWPPENGCCRPRQSLITSMQVGSERPPCRALVSSPISALETLRVRSSLTLLDHIPASSSGCVLVCSARLLQAASDNNKISNSPAKRRGLFEIQLCAGKGMSSIVAALVMSGACVCREDQRRREAVKCQEGASAVMLKPCRGVQHRRRRVSS